MKSALFLFSFLITLSSGNAAFSQNGSLQNTAIILQHMKDAVEVYNPYHYKAQMRFKEMGGDTYEVRNFDISYRANPQNPLYGYDWEITEVVSGGYAYTFMVLPDAMYIIFEGSKSITKQALPQKLDLSSYTESIRDFFILAEVFSPFLNVTPGEIKLRPSGDFYLFTRQMNETTTRELLITRDTYLPIQSVSTIRADDFVQITEVNFFSDEHIKTLPDSAFSIDHYLSLGYSLHENTKSESYKITGFTPENVEYLLYYPFVSSVGDTTSIMASDARYILLDFWYSTCLPCIRAMPEINLVAKKYAKNGLEVIGINCFDMGIRDTVVHQIRENNITMPLYFGSMDITRALGINSFPSYILITSDRKVEFIDGNVEDVRKVLGGIFGK